MHSGAVRYVGPVCLAGMLAVALALTSAANADQLTSNGPTAKPVASAERTTIPPDARSAPSSTVKMKTTPDAELSVPGESVTEKPAAEKPAAEKPAAGEPLQPIAEQQPGGPVEIDAASFKGVTPGVTTVAELEKGWGAPKEISRVDGTPVHLYSVEPFERVEVSLFEDKVISIVIRLQKAFPANAVAQQLKLGNIRRVMVSDEMGQVLGQAFPERGVLFAFEPAKEPGKTTGLVSQIILEPIDAEPFVLRAETNLDSQFEQSLADLDAALKLRPTYARAHWLRARVLSAMGKLNAALAASAQAVQREGGHPNYHITHAQILGQAGRYDEATEQAQKAIEMSERRPHVRARALCLLGDLAGASPKHDYKKAIQYHMEAIKAADPLAADPHPAIRLAAKEVLIDAHLGTAGDVAWGNWKKKDVAVPRWLQRASEFADDLIENEGASEEHRFRVATLALAACVGARGTVDPTEWGKKAVSVGGQLADAASGPSQKGQVQWELAMALYDALQVCQMRDDHDSALRFAQQAIDLLAENNGDTREVPARGYLLGRLCFRLGAIHAQTKDDHKTAVTWFDKATPLLSKPLPSGAEAELGRHGETFVSMGVSYWEIGDKDNALLLTRQGIALIERAVKSGSTDQLSLEVPYSNLATMHQQLGQDAAAQEFIQKADRAKGTKMR